MAHLSYFGTQILPNEIYLFFTEMHEVMGVVNEELHHILIPLGFTVLPLVIGYYCVRKFKMFFEFKTVQVLLILYFLYFFRKCRFLNFYNYGYSAELYTTCLKVWIKV